MITFNLAEKKSEQGRGEKEEVGEREGRGATNKQQVLVRRG